MDARQAKPDDRDLSCEDAGPAEEARLHYHRMRTAEPAAEREARWAAWREENAGAIAAYNAWFEERGHPLARYMILPDGAV